MDRSLSPITHCPTFSKSDLGFRPHLQSPPKAGLPEFSFYDPYTSLSSADLIQDPLSVNAQGTLLFPSTVISAATVTATMMAIAVSMTATVSPSPNGAIQTASRYV